MIEMIQFTYTPDIKVINQEQFDVHMKLYKGYVNSINKIDSELSVGDVQRDQSNTTFSFYRECKRGETYALNGVILHEMYFGNIGGYTQEPGGLLKEYLERDFGSYKKWQEDFIATAKASRGWAVLCFDQRSNHFRNISLDAHDYGNITYSAPALVLDMYEHAYFLQYADKKDEYITNFMNNVNWLEVGNRLTWYAS